MTVGMFESTKSKNGVSEELVGPYVRSHDELGKISSLGVRISLRSHVISDFRLKSSK